MAAKNSRKRVYILALFFVVAAGVGVIYGDIIAEKNKSDSEKSQKYAAQKVLAALNITLTPSPTASPSQTLTPTLPPEPVFTGYCLNVPVLMFHHTAPSVIAKEKGFSSLNDDSGIFDEQMGYIATHGYTSIFAEDLVNALRNHTALPSKSIVITIDDAYDDQYTYAYPILRKYNIKANLMVPTGLLGITSGTNTYFNWQELKEMVGSGVIRAYNHTWSHYAMGTKGAAKDQFEVSTAQKQLNDELGITNDIFTYPYGTNAMSSSVHALLQQNGIIGAFSTIAGSYQCDSFILSLHRTRIGSIPFPAFGVN